MTAFSETYGLFIGIVVAALFVLLLIIGHVIVRKGIPTSSYEEAYKQVKDSTRQYKLMPIAMLFADFVGWFSFRSSFPSFALFIGTIIVDTYMILLTAFAYDLARLARKRLQQLGRMRN